MSLYNDISPQTLMLIGIGVTALFLIVLAVVYHDMRVLSECRNSMQQRIHHLRLHNMLGRLSLSQDKYFRKTSDLDKERHIWVCEHCPNPDVCNRMLIGEQVEPETFCPNYRQLKRIYDGNF